MAIMNIDNFPEPRTEQNMEEYWYALEDRICGLEKTLNNIMGDIGRLKADKYKKPLQAQHKRFQEKKAYWQEQQLAVEEWLIDHEAKGWVSS